MANTTTFSLTELPQAAQSLLDYADDRRIWMFIGEIGAGKTTLIQSLCKILGIEEAVTSPTFSLVNEYLDDNGQSVYHLDLYRLKSEAEAINMGIEDYLYSDAYSFIEWPQIIDNLLPEDVIRINLSVVDDSTRKMVFL
ncbi:MAG: tRNA (adenosine(37)-N6)-threonylcarbamoyltransferase complex ATPase subunit type 1 TsaE [Bacteroidota bacterium]